MADFLYQFERQKKETAAAKGSAQVLKGTSSCADFQVSMQEAVLWMKKGLIMLLYLVS